MAITKVKSKAKRVVKACSPAGSRYRQWSRWERLGYTCWLILNIISALGLLASSYAGLFNPIDYHGAGLVAMTLPAWILLTVVVLVLDLIWWRRTSVVAVLALICCAAPIWNFCPLNLPHGQLSAAEQDRAFTLLTYNVLGFYDRTCSDSGQNPTLDYILEQDADIVCLQEAYSIGVSPAQHITPEQVERVKRQYPYTYRSMTSQTVLSKYPVKAVPIDVKTPDISGSTLGVYHIDIKGHTVTVFNCHLQSIGLNDDDKALYTRLTELEGGRRMAGEVRTQLLSKLMMASRERARQIEVIGRYIKQYGGPNVIVCGDFNDVPGCYSLRRLQDYDLREVYPQVGFGPMITYNANRFYFRIDHILYRGCFKPVDITRGSLKSSDHYPQTVTFVLDE